MIYRRNLIDIISGVVALLPKTITIKSQTTNGDGTISLTVCDLLYAEPLRAVTIGGNPYTIQSIDDVNNILTVSAGLPITVTTFDLYPVHFFSEAPINIDNTLKSIPIGDDKLPCVYMLLKYSEDFDADEFEENNVERNSTFTLFFLTQANFAKWLIRDFLTNAIKPMERLQQQFETLLKKDTKQFNMVDARYTNSVNPRFGVYINNKGDLKSFTSDNLSGCQMDITLSIYYRYGCDC